MMKKVNGEGARKMKYNMEQMQEHVIKMLKATIDICERNGISWYCQAGTVLGAIRHNGLIPWDEDADIIIPNNQIDKFVQCASEQLPKDLYVDYYTVNPKGLRPFPRIGIKGISTQCLHIDVFRLIGLPDDSKEQENMIDEAKKYTHMIKLRRNSVWKLIRKLKFKELLCWISMHNKSRDYYVKKFDDMCARYPYENAKYVMNPSGQYGKKNIFAKEVYGEGVWHDFHDFKVVIPSEWDYYLRQYYNEYMKYPPEAETTKHMKKLFKVVKA